MKNHIIYFVVFFSITWHVFFPSDIKSSDKMFCSFTLLVYYCTQVKFLTLKTECTSKKKKKKEKKKRKEKKRKVTYKNKRIRYTFCLL